MGEALLPDLLRAMRYPTGYRCRALAPSVGASVIAAGSRRGAGGQNAVGPTPAQWARKIFVVFKTLSSQERPVL